MRSGYCVVRDEEVSRLGAWMDGIYSSGPGRVFDIVGQLQCDEELAIVPQAEISSMEIFVLAKHWAGVDVNFRWEYFAYDSNGDIEIAFVELAARRLDRIAELMGDAFVDRAFKEVCDERERTFTQRGETGPEVQRDWKIFRYGTQADWEAFRRERRAEQSKESTTPLPTGLPDRPLSSKASPEPMKLVMPSESSWFTRSERRQRCERAAANYSEGLLHFELVVLKLADGNVSSDVVEDNLSLRRELDALASALGSARVREIYEETRRSFNAEAEIARIVNKAGASEPTKETVH